MGGFTGVRLCRGGSRHLPNGQWKNLCGSTLLIGRHGIAQLVATGFASFPFSHGAEHAGQSAPRSPHVVGPIEPIASQLQRCEFLRRVFNEVVSNGGLQSTDRQSASARIAYQQYKARALPSFFYKFDAGGHCGSIQSAADLHKFPPPNSLFSAGEKRGNGAVADRSRNPSAIGFREPFGTRAVASCMPSMTSGTKRTVRGGTIELGPFGQPT